MRLSCRESFLGYGVILDSFDGIGGRVEEGFGDVSANMRAVATASAKVLNSATGVTFPSMSIAPPITTTSLTFRNVSGSSAAASAKLVNGPIAIIVIVSGGFSRRRRSISL